MEAMELLRGSAGTKAEQRAAIRKVLIVLNCFLQS
jgi:hypothetical protein